MYEYKNTENTKNTINIIKYPKIQQIKEIIHNTKRKRKYKKNIRKETQIQQHIRRTKNKNRI